MNGGTRNTNKRRIAADYCFFNVFVSLFQKCNFLLNYLIYYVIFQGDTIVKQEEKIQGHAAPRGLYSRIKVISVLDPPFHARLRADATAGACASSSVRLRASAVSPERKERGNSGTDSRKRGRMPANCSPGLIDCGAAVLRCLANMSSRKPSGLRMYDGDAVGGARVRASRRVASRRGDDVRVSTECSELGLR